MTSIFESSENGGFHPEVPGYSGAIRALLDDDGTVLEVVPYGSLLSVEKPKDDMAIDHPMEQQAVEPPAQEEVPVQEEETPPQSEE